jgi:molybdate-binding protein
MIVFPRGSGEALELLARGLIHVAGLHRSTPGNPNRNFEAAHKRLGRSARFVRAALWEEGLAVPSNRKPRDVSSVLRNARRWALREEGSAARECFNELFQDSKPHGRCVCGHAGVAEAVRGGWADAGICVRIAAEEANLNFLPIRTEMLDFCFTESQARDPRVLALIRLLQSSAYREMLSELPGYDARETGQMFAS